MMNYIGAILAGLIQGITEFLPISSSGHLVLFHDFFGFGFVDDVAFDVILHLGTAAALLTFFWRDILGYATALLGMRSAPLERRLAWYMIAGTLPAVIAGVLFESVIETSLRSVVVVAWMLIIVGILLYIVDRVAQGTRSIEQLTLPGSILIGCAQALALVPGISRSGITIIAGLQQKLHRQAAARFSFLLSIPVVLGAGAKKIVDIIQNHELVAGNFGVLALGFIVSAITGYLCLGYFLRFLEHHSLRVFAYYRIIFGLILLAILFFRPA